jgi:phenylacetic acid degradation operon negative regulatory protein
MDIICNIQVASPTAPELIQDLLVAHGEMLPVQALCRAGALIGLGESAVRVALNRLATQGKITRCARGFYAINPSGPALSRTVEDWEHKERQIVSWSGSWLGVQDAGVQRSDKTVWRHHNLALALCGFRLFQPGLHLRPDNLAGGVASVRSQLMELGLASQAVVFRLDELDEAHQAKALALWKVDDISNDYKRMQQALKSSARQIESEELDAAVRESLLLGRAVISRLVRDPLLPSEMIVPNARQSLTEDMKDYLRNARVLWLKWLALSYPYPYRQM